MMTPHTEREQALAIENVRRDLKTVHCYIFTIEYSLGGQQRRARSLERQLNRLTRSTSPVTIRPRGRETSSSSSYRRGRSPRIPSYKRPRSLSPPPRTPQPITRTVTPKNDRFYSPSPKSRRSSSPPSPPALRSSPTLRKMVERTPPMPISPSRLPTPTPSAQKQLAQTLPSGRKLPTRLTGRLENKSPERQKSTDSGVQLSLSAEEKRDIEESEESKTETVSEKTETSKAAPKPTKTTFYNDK